MVIGPGVEPAVESSVNVPPVTFVALPVLVDIVMFVLPTTVVDCAPLTLTVDVIVGGLGPTFAANADPAPNAVSSTPMTTQRKNARTAGEDAGMTRPPKHAGATGNYSRPSIDTVGAGTN
jgi:hypothetical protein